MKNTLILLSALFLFSLSSEASFNFSSFDMISNKKIQINSDKPSVFIFMSSQCPCSRGFTDYVNKLAKSYKGKIPFYVVVSNNDEKWGESKKYFTKFGFEIPVLMDRKAEIADHFGALKTPHSFVTNTLGDVIYSGGVTDRRMIEDAKLHYLKDVLTSVSENKKPKWKKTRALGCYIRRA